MCALRKETRGKVTEGESVLRVTCCVDSSLIRTPVARMISVIYIIELIVSCLHTAAAVYIFFISKSLPASCDGAPRGNIILFDVVPFQQINRLALTLTRSQTATDCSEPLCDYQQLAFPRLLPFHSLYLPLFNLCLRFSEVFLLQFFLSLVFCLCSFLLVLSFFRPPAAVDFEFCGKTCFWKAKQCTSRAQLQQIAE